MRERLAVLVASLAAVLAPSIALAQYDPVYAPWRQAPPPVDPNVLAAASPIMVAIALVAIVSVVGALVALFVLGSGRSNRRRAA
jgi:hypothetical protein